MSEITLPVAPAESFFGIVRYPPGGIHGPRVQRGLQFVLLLAGSVQIEVEGALLTLLPGQMALLLPGRHEFFRFDPQQESEHSWCQLDFEQTPVDLDHAFAGVSPWLPINSEIEQLMELGLAVTGASHIDNRMARIKLGEALLHYYLALDAQPPELRSRPLPRVVRDACKLIAARFSEPLTLERIAASCHCSVNHLINQFRRSLDTTPSRYLWRLRVARSEALLRQTDVAVAAIAEQCGFVSPYHYSRQFKSVHGLSPRAYRQRYRARQGRLSPLPDSE